MAKTNLTSTQFAAKKLLGKVQTNNKFTEAQEAYPTNVSVISDGVFAEDIPAQPGTAYNTVFSASSDSPATVERVYFDLVSIADSIYDADDSDGGGEENPQSQGPHAYYLKLPSNYETVSNNPNRGTGSFTNGSPLYTSNGGLQIVPPFATNAGLPGISGNNLYGLQLYKGDPAVPSNVISETDAIDWQVDYYAGTIFLQDYDSNKIPVTASAYLYVGKYLDEKLTDLSSSIGSGGGGTDITIKDEGTNLTTTAASINFVGSGVAATTSGNDVTVTINGGISFSHTPVTASTTSSVSDSILGVSGTAAIEIRLPGAEDFDAGQYFTVKDESGAADTKNITILASGSQKIDGQSSIVLESPYAAVNIYSDGVGKFFIY